MCVYGLMRGVRLVCVVGCECRAWVQCVALCACWCVRVVCVLVCACWCVRVGVCVLCVVCGCVWCGVCLFVWHAENLRVCIQHGSVCAFKTFPCVPATCAHVFKKIFFSHALCDVGHSFVAQSHSIDVPRWYVMRISSHSRNIFITDSVPKPWQCCIGFLLFHRCLRHFCAITSAKLPSTAIMAPPDVHVPVASTSVTRASAAPALKTQMKKRHPFIITGLKCCAFVCG